MVSYFRSVGLKGMGMGWCRYGGKLMKSRMKRSQENRNKLMKTGVIEASVMEPNPEHILPFEVQTGLLKAVCLSMTF